MKIRTLVIVALVVMLAALGASAWLHVHARTAYRGYGGTEQFVDIPTGSGSRAIGARLVEAGVVRDALTYRYALWLSGQSRALKAGEYRFDRPVTAIEVVQKLAHGEVYVVNVTFPEGLNLMEMGMIFESHGLGTAADFGVAARDVSLIAAIDPKVRNLEGYLFPETYALSRHANADQLVRDMVVRFERVLTSEVRSAASARGLSIHDLVTLASIVEKETANAQERPLISAVYQNRLKLKMPLQCDPTVIYALQRAGKFTGNLRRVDLAVESPYNTYRYVGLPPGPIAAPGGPSLESVAHPADVPYLYFVSKNDGTHAFAQTLEEHNRNVQKYQVQYFHEQQAGRAGKAGGTGRAGGAGRAGGVGAGEGQRSPHFNFSRSTSK